MATSKTKKSLKNKIKKTQLAKKKAAAKVVKKAAKAQAKAKSKAKPKVLTKTAKTAKTAKAAKTKVPAKTNSKTLTSSKVKWSEFVTPLDDRILVAVEKFEKTPGGLFIPATASDKPQRGQVLVVGRGHRDSKGRLRPMDVKAGDEVLFAQYSGTSLNMQNQEVLLLRESEVLGVVSA